MSAAVVAMYGAPEQDETECGVASAYRYRVKPAEVEAFQMTRPRRADNSEWPQWLHEAWQARVLFPSDWPHSDGTDILKINTREGSMFVRWGDWIIRGGRGELFVRNQAVFERTYEAAP